MADRWPLVPETPHEQHKAWDLAQLILTRAGSKHCAADLATAFAAASCMCACCFHEELPWEAYLLTVCADSSSSIGMGAGSGGVRTRTAPGWMG